MGFCGRESKKFERLLSGVVMTLVDLEFGKIFI